MQATIMLINVIATSVLIVCNFYACCYKNGLCFRLSYLTGLLHHDEVVQFVREKCYIVAKRKERGNPATCEKETYGMHHIVCVLQ